MLNKILSMIKEHKEELLVLVAFLTIVTILGYIYQEVISILTVILVILLLINMENIVEYVSQWLEERQQQKTQAPQQKQTIQGAGAYVIHQELSGQFGKIIGAIPPGTIKDVYPTNVPSILTHNGVTFYSYEAHRNPGSQPMTTGNMKNLLNGYLKKAATSCPLPPKQSSTFIPYFHAVAVTRDTALADTYVFHLVYVEDSFNEAFVENHMREEAEVWRRNLVDTQPPDDEEF